MQVSLIFNCWHHCDRIKMDKNEGWFCGSGGKDKSQNK